jgi:membrane-associated protease RseP (regulator of RpoE activity)
MAINPNTDFVAGAILTASQQNRFPRGVVAYTASTTAPTAVGPTEAVILTGGSFTAVANRYYRVTYFEPQSYTASGSPALLTTAFRLTNLAGAVQRYSIKSQAGVNTQDNYVTMTAVLTFSAGATNLVVTGKSSTIGSTIGYVRDATSVAFLLVEDIGPS